MTSYKQIIMDVSKLIDQSELAELLNKLWKKIEWVAHMEASGNEATLSAEGNTTIHLFPALLQNPKAGELVLHEFGKLILLRSGDNGLSIWDKKLDVPSDAAISLAVSKLGDVSLRQKCSEFKDVLDYYPERGHSVERLVYINIVNALLANNLSYGDSVNVDIREWGPCIEYCARKKYHSLIPLTSAYSPADIHNDFGSALAALIVDNLTQVRDSSVAYAFRGIIQRIVKLACGEN
jgi:hypothetical protein